jgi:succinylarginine dihydrolase
LVRFRDDLRIKEVSFNCFFNGNAPLPKRFPARQTDEACKALARLHQLPLERVIFAQQNPEAIDAGVFHNDVISVGNQNLFLYHEKAFVNTESVIAEIQHKVEAHCQTAMHFIKVSQEQISIEEAIKTYFFNSQIVTKPDQTMALVAPEECKESEQARRFLEELIRRSDQPIRQLLYLNLSESMKNGGGPACLRFRVVLNAKEIVAMSPFVLLTNSLYQNLVEWVNKHYRDRLTFQDLADPKLLMEGRKALDELAWMLQLGPIYPFQRMASNPK